MTYRLATLSIALPICALFAFASTSAAAPPDTRPTPVSSPSVIEGGVQNHTKADSVVILGADGTLEGQFQNAQGNPDWQGWETIDNTGSAREWSVSTYFASQLDPQQDVNYAWWCGTTFDNACAQGYGHNWDTSLSWSGVVADPSYGVEIRVIAMANIHILDLGYDVLTLQAETYEQGWIDVASYDGTYLPTQIFETFYLDFNQLMGPQGDEVNLRWRFTSDSGYDDEDCQLDSIGPIMLDNIEVWFRWGQSSDFVKIGPTETCQPGDTLQWVPGGTGSVGNFAKLWTGLDDIDPCATNGSSQLAFIDDGLVEPGTGGTSCQTWCYGPGGYIVNPEGGLSGPENHIDNMAISPLLAWPEPEYDGFLIEFDVYRHLINEAGSTGIYYQWKLRTAGAGEDIDASEWVNDDSVYYGFGDYFRFSKVVSEDIPAGTEQIQVALGVIEAGYWWNMTGTDGTPAPYFDNVRLTAFRHEGPAISIRKRELAQDGWPAHGYVNTTDLATNSVRFDAAMNLGPSGTGSIVPGDTITVDDRQLPRVGIVGTPSLHYRLFPNPLFDPYRSAVPPGTGNTSYQGLVDCSLPQPPYDDGQRFFADLPDTGFFFPGDVIHYYFSATDTNGGVSFVPADTAGFSTIPSGAVTLADFYDRDFTVHALPSLKSATPGDHPKILLWDDADSDEERDAWLRAMSGLALTLGDDYDLYATRAPDQGHGNGLGTRGGYGSLAGYETILYTSGVQTENTITTAELEGDAGDDIFTLEAWLYENHKTLVLMGDNLATDLWNDPAPMSQSFLTYTMGVSWLASDVRSEIDGQIAPTVWPLPGDPIFGQDGWIANAGCPGINTFDHIGPTGSGYESAEFLEMSGASGVYTASAAVTAQFTFGSSETITMPYGLAAIDEIQQLPKGGLKGFYPAGPMGLLHAVLDHAGHQVPSPVPAKFALSLAAYPNPFNPRTEIQYSLDVSGPVTLDLYDVRGRLVRSLLDEVRPAGGSAAVWDGRDDSGRSMSSGVYFCIMQAESGRRAMKVTILK